jgi:glycosyltransferase involved in cell wall biosynthesis
MSVFDWPEGFSPRFAAWYRFLLPKLLQRALRIITDSEFTKGRILAHVDIRPEKITVIPCGVSPHFRPEAISEAGKAIASQKLPSRNYILTVGSLEARKNLARLFRAWGQVWERMPEDLWLVVVGGKGSGRVFANVQVDRMPPRVFLADRVDDSELPALYAGALGLAYVSLYEGFGLPPLEAMASGIPVLVGNRSSLPEVVGDAGILVDPENEEEIAEGIRALVENSALRRDLRERGLLRARKFSWDETARRTWHVLQAAAAN